jgi:hypothetical protein
MKVKAVTRYPFKGKEYNSLKAIKEEVHNIIGLEVLDKVNRKIELRHKDLLPLLELLCSKEVRDVLVECLSITYYDEFEDKDINILDIK